MKISKPVIFTWSVVLLSIFSFSVQAASWRTCDDKKQRWKSDWTNMYLSTTSFPIGSVYEQRTQWMMSEWNKVGGSNFKFYVGRDTDGSHNKSNGKNEVYWETAGDDEYLGITWSRWNCSWWFGTNYGYKETDIGMNDSYSWTTADYDGSSSGSPYNFELVMLHELGHALGLLHSNGNVATMNSIYANGGSIAHYRDVEPHGNDRHGLKILYPDSTTERDMAVSRHKNNGNSTTYNKITNLSYKTVTYPMPYPLPPLQFQAPYLQKGSFYSVEYTMENLGTQIENSVSIRFYLSTNSYISTGDTYLGSSSWNIPSGSIVEAVKTFRVPSSLPTGTYHIGYIVDSDNNITEGDEGNNFVSLLLSYSVE